MYIRRYIHRPERNVVLGYNYYSFDKIVGGSCLSSPARMHFGALKTAIQQLGSIACMMHVINNS